MKTLPDIGEFSSIVELAVEEISKPPPRRDVFRGRVLEVVRNSKARYARIAIAFPMGELGNHLSTYFPTPDRGAEMPSRLFC